MPQSKLSIKEVAATLHVSTREVIRLAEQKILPGQLVRGQWQFRAGEIWNWIEVNLHDLPDRRKKDRHAEPTGDLLISPVLSIHGIAVGLSAKTKASILRELAALAEGVDSSIDAARLAQSLREREAQGSTGLQDGVAIPHPARPVFSEGPIVVAARTQSAIPFGQRDGGLTDLFFLVCCPDHTRHLLFLGRLCRLLIDKSLQAELREADDASTFYDAIQRAERKLCRD